MKKYKFTDVIDFGKWKGEKIADIFVWQKDYFYWLLNNVDRFELSECAKEKINKIPKRKKSNHNRKMSGTMEHFEEVIGSPDGGWGNGI